MRNIKHVYPFLLSFVTRWGKISHLPAKLYILQLHITLHNSCIPTTDTLRR